MTTYALANASATDATIAAALANGHSQSVNPSGSQSPINPQTQTFMVVATTTSGNVTATVQIYASNDGVNWVAYGSAITIASGASPQIGNANGSQPWQFYTALVSSLTGVGAQCKVLMGV